MVKENKQKCIELGHQPKSPRKAIKEFCLDCCNGSWNEVNLCCSKLCVLHQYRKGRSVNEQGEKLKYNPKLIKSYCLTCVENYPEVVNCQCTDCVFWPFRLGGSPWREKNMSEERKEKLRENLARVRAIKNVESAPVGLVKEN